MKIAINGLGRIGRCVLRTLLENPRDNVELVAINARIRPGETVHAYQERIRLALQYDSVHGRIQENVVIDDTGIRIGTLPTIALLQVSTPSECPWHDLKVDTVLDCTGQFKSQDTAGAHLTSGAKQVLISAPGDASIKRTIVYGVNHNSLQKEDTLVSNASCTTNCLAPILKVINDRHGIEHGLMTTVHAITGDQRLVDGTHSDPRRARAAMASMIPTKTGAAKTIGRVLPELDQKLDGYAIRVPTLNVSLLDLTLQLTQPAHVDAINEVFMAAEAGDLNGVLATHQDPLVSCDFNHHPASCIVDLQQTRIQGHLLKVCAWYDNEWGFANRMLDTACKMHEVAVG